jgi:hypothetical protein
MLVASIAPYTEQRRITRFIYTAKEEEKLNSKKTKRYHFQMTIGRPAERSYSTRVRGG